MNNKVAKIEFHITAYEVDDFIIKSAKLIKEGYTVESIKTDPISFSYRTVNPEPPIHILMRKKYDYNYNKEL